LAIVLLIFGPRRLPELGNTMGKAIRNFKDSLSGVEEAKYRHIEDKPGQPVNTTSTTTTQQAHAETVEVKPAGTDETKKG